jgi:UTP-glucose-1-phosphate uridylyltransferase
VVTSEVLDGLERLARATPPGCELQLTDGFAALLGRSLPVMAVPFGGEVFDSGTPEDYARSAARYPC